MAAEHVHNAPTECLGYFVFALSITTMQEFICLRPIQIGSSAPEPVSNDHTANVDAFLSVKLYKHKFPGQLPDLSQQIWKR